MGRTLSMAEIYAFRFGEQNKVKIFIQCSDIIIDLIQGIKKIRMNSFNFITFGKKKCYQIKI